MRMKPLNDFAKGHRDWLIKEGLPKPDQVNPFSGKSYRSMIFQFNLTHPDHKIVIAPQIKI